jgi:hypothetical protein
LRWRRRGLEFLRDRDAKADNADADASADDIAPI